MINKYRGNIKGGKHNTRAVSLMIGFLLSTIFLGTLLLQLTYAQNASSASKGSAVTTHGHEMTVTTQANNTATTSTVTTHENQITITTGPKTTEPLSGSTSSLTANLRIGNKMFPLNYQITGSGNKVTSIVLEKNKSTLLINISSPSSGTLTIELPRNIIDSKKQGTNLDDNYAVLIDGRSSAFDQIKNNSQVRTLAIDIHRGSTQIELAGTHTIPEFDTAILATIGIAITGTILARIKFNDKGKVKHK